MVQMYKKSLILRICMTEKPFVHNKAFANVKTSFLYHKDVAEILFKVLNKKNDEEYNAKRRLKRKNNGKYQIGLFALPRKCNSKL